MKKFSFLDFIYKKENYGGSALDPSSAEDEGEDPETIIRNGVGAFPTFSVKGDDLPITKKNKLNYMKKCNCKQNKK